MLGPLDMPEKLPVVLCCMSVSGLIQSRPTIICDWTLSQSRAVSMCAGPSGTRHSVWAVGVLVGARWHLVCTCSL